VILVADSLKYERTAPVRIGHLSDVDHFVTDAPLPARLQRICDEHQVAVEVALDGSRQADAASA